MVRVNPAPKDASDWYRLGNQREDEGRDVEARDCFERAVAADPAHARAWNNLGAARERLGDAAGAELAYRTALEREPALLQPSLNLGRLHEARGQAAQAAAIYRAARAHHPSDDRLAHLLAATSGENTARAPRAYVQALFDEQASRFEEHLVSELGYGVPQAIANLLAPLLREPASSRAVLDLGCGTGLVGVALAGTGAVVTGVDLSPGMLAQASKRGAYAKLLKDDVVEALAHWEPASLAAITAADVFIYLGDLESVFAAAARALAPGGAFAFSVEGLAEGTYRLQPTGRYAHAAPYLRRLAAGAGLRVAHEEPVQIRKQGRGYAEGEVLLLRKA